MHEMVVHKKCDKVAHPRVFFFEVVVLLKQGPQEKGTNAVK